MYAQTSLPNWLKICVKALGVKVDVFFLNGSPRPTACGRQRARQCRRGPLKTAQSADFQNFSLKFRVCKYYIHAKNIGCNPHPAAAAVETAPKLLRAAKHLTVGRF